MGAYVGAAHSMRNLYDAVRRMLKQALMSQQRVDLRVTAAEGAEALQRAAAAPHFQDVLAETLSGGGVEDTTFFKRSEEHTSELQSR